MPDDPAMAERYNLGNDQFDACVGSGEMGMMSLAVLNDLHRIRAERAAAAGLHVPIEKPLAGFGADGWAVIAACR